MQILFVLELGFDGQAGLDLVDFGASQRADRFGGLDVIDDQDAEEIAMLVDHVKLHSLGDVVAGTDVVLISTNSYFRDLNFTGFSGTWSLSTLNMYGNLTLSSTMNAPAAATVLTATGGNAYIGSNRTITTHGKSGNMLFYISYAANSNVTMSLQDDYVGTYPIATAIEVTSGTLNLNNHNVTAGGIVLAGSSLKTINLGSGNIILNGSGTVWGANASNGNTTVIPGTSTIFLSNASAKTFDGGSRTYYNVVQAGAGNLTIQGNNTLNTLSANTANTAIIFTANTTTTVSNFTVSGNAGNLVTLKSSTTGTKFNLSAASGVISVDYLSISDSNATGGASWYAGSHSSNVANNVGWIFSAAPAGGNGISITGGTFFDTSTGGITFTF